MGSGFGVRLSVLIYKMPHGWRSLFDLSEPLMPSLDERLDLPAHGKSLMLLERKRLYTITSNKGS